MGRTILVAWLVAEPFLTRLSLKIIGRRRLTQKASNGLFKINVSGGITGRRKGEGGNRVSSQSRYVGL